jgi:hypothetical protein
MSMLTASVLAGCSAAATAPPQAPATGPTVPSEAQASGQTALSQAPAYVLPDPLWNSAIARLQQGDDAGARRDLEQAAGRDVGRAPLAHEAGSPTGDALFLRDLAEVRLATGDDGGAAAAAAAARATLASEGPNARFDDADRRLFDRSLDALEAAAVGDEERLVALAEQPDPPAADAWYLAGWLAERRGRPDRARAGYRAYLALAPAWGYLRRTALMRQHAEQVMGRGS